MIYKSNPYTGVPYNIAPFYSDLDFVEHTQEELSLLKRLWASKPLTQRFNLERIAWSKPVWPKVNVNFTKGNK